MIGSDIINSAYRKNGIASPSTPQTANGLEALNDLLSSLSADGLIIPYTTSETFTLVVGTASYTWGSGGTITTTRPLRVIDAYIRDSNGVDYPVDVTMTEKEYDAIADKDASARPTRLYYNPQFTLGKIYLDYAPDAAETLYLISEKPLTEIATAATTVSLPDFYKNFLKYNLAVILAAELKNKLSVEIVQLAVESKNTVENINALNKQMNTVKMDSAITWSVL